MFAVIKAGGKQYRVAPEDVIRIDRVGREPGQVIAFGEVLVVGGDTAQLGTPTVAGATVAGEVLQHTRGDKVIAFKKRRRQNSRRKRGYRHEFSMIRITEILTDGAKPSDTPPPRPKGMARPQAEAPAGAEGEVAAEAGAAEAKPKKAAATKKASGTKKAAAAKKPAAKKPATKGKTAGAATKGKKK
jgi:large subunit ribosomal protein L21